MEEKLRKRAESWLDTFFDEATRGEVKQLLDSDPKGLSDAFFKDLSFGTGGMRGEMGVGTNRMNVYTVRIATEALARYLQKQSHSGNGHAVFIGYDTRHHSKEFAEIAARVLAAHNIRVKLTEEFCPTPLVSFGCRYYQCRSAIMITASHNPPQYNGYKVYWSDGGQVVPPHDEGILKEARGIAGAKETLLAKENSPFIQRIGKELDEAYLAELVKLQLYPEVRSSLRVVYSPLHGTGIRVMPNAMARLGYQPPALVEEQCVLDGNFSAAPYPNPEVPKAMELGIRKLTQTGADLFIATDPDADRIGVVAMDRGKPYPFTGNQMACICLHHICKALKERGKLPRNAAFVKTIVTTELFRAIAESFGGTCIDVLTGFKYIAEQIHLWETHPGGYEYIYGAEESYGSLFRSFVRDKDAISSACLCLEAGTLAKQEKITLVERLNALYREFGVHRETLVNLVFDDSEAGMKKMGDIMQQLRTENPVRIGDIAIVSIEDYESRTARNLKTGAKSKIALPKSDVLRYWLEDGTKLVIRPSGTEPKVKIYAEVVEKNTNDIDRAIATCDERLQSLISAFKKDIGV